MFFRCFVVSLLFYFIFSASVFSHEPLLLNGLDQWKIFETLKNSDKKILSRLENHFSNLVKDDFYKAPSKCHSIPKVIHFVWIGPSRFPEDSKKNLTSWITNNPNYKFKFWTDRKRNGLPNQLEFEFIDSDFFQFFSDEYIQSENYGEKSDLIRYEVLFREGGVYVDHDVLSYQSINTLLERSDFFVGLEPPHLPLGESAITVCNNIIGSRKEHPILEETIKSIKKDWISNGYIYEGNSKDMITRRVFFRTFLPFSNSVLKLLNSKSFVNVVLPPIFFNDIAGDKGIFANHEYAGSWFNSASVEEKFFKRKLEKISKKTNKIFGILGLILLINIFLVIVLIKNLIINKKNARY